jgi:hypothetical protein
MDFVYLGVVAMFFVLTGVLLKLCEVLQKDTTGGKS